MHRKYFAVGIVLCRTGGDGKPMEVHSCKKFSLPRDFALKLAKFLNDNNLELSKRTEVRKNVRSSVV